ncbi:APC/C activator protein CDH1 [Cucumispora dikerogammari]|nr:APC/C activator protein CDH1 [Cucumispora dikerogammari]
MEFQNKINFKNSNKPKQKLNERLDYYKNNINSNIYYNNNLLFPIKFSKSFNTIQSLLNNGSLLDTRSLLNTELKLENTNILNSNILNTNILNSRLENSNIINTRLENTNIINSRLENTNILNSNLESKLQIITNPILTIKNISLSDDFYSNILDWPTIKYIYFANNTNFYQINTITQKKTRIHTFKQIISSLKSISLTTIIIGFINGTLILYDLNKNIIVDLPSHNSRICIIENNSINKNLIFTGSRDKSIRILDLNNNKYNQINKHLQEVTGLKLNPLNNLLCSGGNDNKLFVYDLRLINKALFSNYHKAAIRAISWSKFNLLFTGGGTADRKIKVWNLDSLTKVNDVCFNSQVCNLDYIFNLNLVISSHGYSQNDVKIFNLDLKLFKVFKGHKNRVLFFCLNEFENQFVTGSSDNCIKIWEI